MVFMLIKLQLILFIFISSAFSSENINIGVLAFQSKAETLKKWESTAHYLHQMEPNYTFTILPLSIPEINEAVKNNKLDFVVTNSGHYVYLENKYHISRIATMKTYKDGQWHDQFGGVIFTRADRGDIKTLDDLKGKKIAIVDIKSFGGLAVELYELFHYDIKASDLSMYFVDMPQQKVLKAVLDGSADAGFVRTNVLENMAEQGRLDLRQIKIIHLQKLDNFPYILSTALYPEWPISRAANTSKDLSDKIVVALLQRFVNTKPMEGSIGWSSPVEYDKINNIFKILRIPPYDHPETFTIKDIWNKYKNFSFVLIAFLVMLGWMYRKNSYEKAYIKSILDASPNFMIVTNGKDLISANQSILAYFGYITLDEFERDHHCICDFFEAGDTNEYLPSSKDDKIWIEYVLSHPEREHKVKITVNGKTSIFRVDVSAIRDSKEFEVIAIFTDISLMLNQSITDPLTKVANRLHFDLLFKHSLRIARREKTPLSVIFFDIDHFKRVNDNFGHLVGDDVLQHMAHLVKSMLRQSDVFARWGGEEFILLLPNTTLEFAVQVAENLRNRIEHENFNTVGHITCSFGVSDLHEDEIEDTLLHRVDELLYYAKTNGRNKVMS